MAGRALYPGSGGNDPFDAVGIIGTRGVDLSSREPRSSFLFADPSIIEGLARLLDIGGTLNEYNRSEDPDGIALAMDWKMIAADLQRAYERLEKQVGRSTTASPA